MRQALIPITAHNDRVETQKPGYCVCFAGNLFACDPKDKTHGEVLWLGGHFGWCKAGGHVRVWHSLAAASTIAGKMGGRVVTVPRVIGETSKGVVRVWEAVA